MKIPAAFLASCLTLIIAQKGWADLAFEKTEVVVKAALEDRNALAEFVFSNTGDHPVKITKVTTDCGCTTASLQKRDYAPGEQGRLVTIFDFGSRIGPYRKKIVIETDEGKRAPIILSLVVEIPEVLSFSPPSLEWKTGDSVEGKIAGVASKFGARPLEVYSTNKAFRCELKEEAGKSFIEVHPLDTKTEVRGFIQVRTDLPGDAPRWVSLMVHIAGETGLEEKKGQRAVSERQGTWLRPAGGSAKFEAKNGTSKNTRHFPFLPTMKIAPRYPDEVFALPLLFDASTVNYLSKPAS